MSEAEDRGSEDMSQRFMSKRRCFPKRESCFDGVEDEEGDIELSLGLSLNGRFGVDPLAKMKLTRTSSIPDFIISHTSVNSRSLDLDKQSKSLVHVGPALGITRTCSLPTETEEEWRKRKQLQSLRRLEAKRKRSEKQRTLRTLREKQKSVGEEKFLEERTEEGSIGSSGSGSSGLSELDSITPVQGTRSKNSDTRSPTSAAAVTAPPPPQKPDSQVREGVRNVLEDMPFVSTKGNGPSGKRVDGFLYRYRKGEEVRIVCVCHGSFLSPADFVKHAGGSDDVEHPLKHIVVNPSPFL